MRGQVPWVFLRPPARVTRCVTPTCACSRPREALLRGSCGGDSIGGSDRNRLIGSRTVGGGLSGQRCAADRIDGSLLVALPSTGCLHLEISRGGAMVRVVVVQGPFIGRVWDKHGCGGGVEHDVIDELPRSPDRTDIQCPRLGERAEMIPAITLSRHSHRWRRAGG